MNTKIYNCFSLNRYLIDSIQKNYLVFTCPSELNDLYVCQLPVNNVDTNSMLYQKAVECCRHRLNHPLKVRRKNEGSFGARWEKFV